MHLVVLNDAKGLTQKLPVKQSDYETTYPK
jgi:hypothetical protein